jgi:DNA-binding transcriptional regulator YhcF (GntR family)
MNPLSQPVTVERLGISLDRDAEVPLGVQLAWALRARIDAGALASGERLPALRDLAEGLGVNSNTIRAVYQRLEHEGLISSLQGSGTFVTAGARERSAVGAIAAAAAHEARETGVDPREVAATLYVARESPAEGGGSEARPPDRAQRSGAAGERVDRAERRRQLRGRIAALEQALADLEVQHPRLARIARARKGRSASGPRLLDTAELEQVQTELLRRIAAIQTAIDARPEGGKGPGGKEPKSAPAAQPSPAPAAKARAHRPKIGGATATGRGRATTRPATTGT